MPTSENYAYLAGILDGEGYLKATNCGQLRVGMCSEVTIKWLQRMFGGSANGPYRTNQGKLTKWEWCLAVRGNEDLLRQVIPYMVTRQARAKALLAFAEHGHTRPSAQNQHTRYRPENIAWNVKRIQLQAAVRAA